MTFHIGSQSGGVVNNVGGDQHITGGQQGSYVSAAEAGQAVAELRRALAREALSPGVAAAAYREIDEVERETSAAQPDREHAATALERLVRLLGRTTSFALTGLGMVSPLTTLVGWLGPLGARVAALLPTGL